MCVRGCVHVSAIEVHGKGRGGWVRVRVSVCIKGNTIWRSFESLNRFHEDVWVL